MVSKVYSFVALRREDAIKEFFAVMFSVWFILFILYLNKRSIGWELFLIGNLVLMLPSIISKKRDNKIYYDTFLVIKNKTLLMYGDFYRSLLSCLLPFLIFSERSYTSFIIYFAVIVFLTSLLPIHIQNIKNIMSISLAGSGVIFLISIIYLLTYNILTLNFLFIISVCYLILVITLIPKIKT